MYCPNCGKSEQVADTYCRACGGFLTKPGSSSRMKFGGTTPQQNLTSINVLSLIAAFSSLLVGIWMYLTNFSLPAALYLGAALLMCNAVWHLTNFVIGTRLKRRLKGVKQMPAGEIVPIVASHTSELLPAANPADQIPDSVTEDTTRHLAPHLRR